MIVSRNNPNAAAGAVCIQEQIIFRPELNEALPSPLSAKGERIDFPIFRSENHFFILLSIQSKIIIQP
jgi:hypothetical protein